MNRSYFPGLTLACLLGLATSAPAAPIAVVDQQNVMEDSAFFTAQNTIGQSFVPSLAGIDSIEFALGPYSSSELTVYVNLRDGVSGANGLGGPILGTSNSLVIPASADVATRHFDFPSTIALTPGNVYAAELVGTTGFSGTFSDGDRYPLGQSLAFLTSAQDLIFTEGLHVPEPASAILAAAGFFSLSLIARGRRV